MSTAPPFDGNASQPRREPVVGGGGSYRIERVDSSSWRIVDDSVAPQKREHVVASIEEVDESV